MKRVTRLLPALFAAPLALSALAVGSGPADADDTGTPAYSTTTLHFKVTVGPADDKPCDIVGDLYVPDEASATNRLPAVLTTNGFGGSKNDQAATAKALATRGYVVLSYSGLGFGGSSCKITLDDPDYDGKAASQLVSYLGGADGIAFADKAHQQPAAVLDAVRLDAPGDPRVGTFGGSYGGGFQFAVASVDKRVDALVPLITWNDLTYSLAPNSIRQTGVTSATPGVAKLMWATGFTVSGVQAELSNAQMPPDLVPCPNFADFVCPALVLAGATGVLPPASIAALRHASVASYIEKITVPTLLVQGQRDTLFNLNEATATYRALEAQGTETKMVWMLGGHSGAGAPGEVSWENPSDGYVSGRILNWFEHHLKDSAVDTGPEFAYFRDWVEYDGNAEPAYATSPTYPVGVSKSWHASGKYNLTTGNELSGGPQNFIVPGAGLPTRLDEMDVFGSFLGPISSAVSDVYGTYASYTTAPFSAPLRVAGQPTAELVLTSPITSLLSGLGAGAELVIFVKLVDIAPDGSHSLINGLEAPVRVGAKPGSQVIIDVTLPAIVHEFGVGHRLALAISGGSVNYRGSVLPAYVRINDGGQQSLTLPVVD